MANTATCAECARSLPLDQTIPYGDVRVCGACKPVFLQKLREGAKVGKQLSYAGFWVRFGAAFLDGLLLGVFNMLLGFVLGAMLGGPDPESLGVFGLLWVVQIGIAIAYETYFIGKQGATPGKMALRLRVVTPSGGPVSYGRAFGRYFGKLVSSFTLAIGFIIAAFDDEKRALHDRMCSTRVVRV